MAIGLQRAIHELPIADRYEHLGGGKSMRRCVAWVVTLVAGVLCLYPGLRMLWSGPGETGQIIQPVKGTTRPSWPEQQANPRSQRRAWTTFCRVRGLFGNREGKRACTPRHAGRRHVSGGSKSHRQFASRLYPAGSPRPERFGRPIRTARDDDFQSVGRPRAG